MRSRSFLALLCVLAVVACAACGGDDGAGAADTTSTTTTVDPDTPVSGPANSDPGASDPAGWQRTEPTGTAVTPTPVAFDPGQAEATDDGLLVRFYGGVDPCFVLDRADVVETADTVTVRLFGGAPAGQQDAVCIEIAVGYEVLVHLDAPLGARTVIDGSA